MNWDEGGHGERCGCSACGYDGANGEALSEGDTCPLCSQGTMLSEADFQDKFNTSI